MVKDALEVTEQASESTGDGVGVKLENESSYSNFSHRSSSPPPAHRSFRQEDQGGKQPRRLDKKNKPKLPKGAKIGIGVGVTIVFVAAVAVTVALTVIKAKSGKGLCVWSGGVVEGSINVTSCKKGTFDPSGLTTGDKATTHINLGKRVDVIPTGMFNHFTNLQCITVDQNNMTFMGYKCSLMNKAGDTLLRVPIGYAGDVFLCDPKTETLAVDSLKSLSHIEKVYVPLQLDKIEDGAFGEAGFVVYVSESPEIPEVENKTQDPSFPDQGVYDIIIKNTAEYPKPITERLKFVETVQVLTLVERPVNGQFWYMSDIDRVGFLDPITVKTNEYALYRDTVHIMQETPIYLGQVGSNDISTDKHIQFVSPENKTLDEMKNAGVVEYKTVGNVLYLSFSKPARYSINVVGGEAKATYDITVLDTLFMKCIGYEFSVPTDTKELTPEMFRFCDGIRKITIPSSVQSVVSDPFSHISTLMEIVVDPANTIYESVHNMLVEKATKTLVGVASGTMKAANFVLNIEGILNIDSATFYSFDSVVMPGTSVDYKVFHNTNEVTRENPITKLVVGDTIKLIARATGANTITNQLSVKCDKCDNFGVIRINQDNLTLFLDTDLVVLEAAVKLGGKDITRQVLWSNGSPQIHLAGPVQYSRKFVGEHTAFEIPVGATGVVFTGTINGVHCNKTEQFTFDGDMFSEHPQYVECEESEESYIYMINGRSIHIAPARPGVYNLTVSFVGDGGTITSLDGQLRFVARKIPNDGLAQIPNSVTTLVPMALDTIGLKNIRLHKDITFIDDQAAHGSSFWLPELVFTGKFMNGDAEVTETTPVEAGTTGIKLVYSITPSVGFTSQIQVLDANTGVAITEDSMFEVPTDGSSQTYKFELVVRSEDGVIAPLSPGILSLVLHAKAVGDKLPQILAMPELYSEPGSEVVFTFLDFNVITCDFVFGANYVATVDMGHLDKSGKVLSIKCSVAGTGTGMASCSVTPIAPLEGPLEIIASNGRKQLERSVMVRSNHLPPKVFVFPLTHDNTFKRQEVFTFVYRTDITPSPSSVIIHHVDGTPMALNDKLEHSDATVSMKCFQNPLGAIGSCDVVSKVNGVFSTSYSFGWELEMTTHATVTGGEGNPAPVIFGTSTAAIGSVFHLVVSDLVEGGSIKLANPKDATHQMTFSFGGQKFNGSVNGITKATVEVKGNETFVQISTVGYAEFVINISATNGANLEANSLAVTFTPTGVPISAPTIHGDRTGVLGSMYFFSVSGLSTGGMVKIAALNNSTQTITCYFDNMVCEGNISGVSSLSATLLDTDIDVQFLVSGKTDFPIEITAFNKTGQTSVALVVRFLSPTSELIMPVSTDEIYQTPVE